MRSQPKYLPKGETDLPFMKQLTLRDTAQPPLVCNNCHSKQPPDHEQPPKGPSRCEVCGAAAVFKNLR